MKRDRDDTQLTEKTRREVIDFIKNHKLAYGIMPSDLIVYKMILKKTKVNKK